MADAAADCPIATIPKNGREELRVALSEYGGHKLLSLRVWFSANDGGKRPGREGFALKVEKLSELRAALDVAEAEALAMGWLPAAD